MEDLSDPVAIGVVVAPHGVRGSLRVRALGAGRHLRKDMEPVVAGVRRRISAARQTPKGFLLDLDGIVSRTDAQALGGEELFLDREELDAPGPGEFYVADLVGLMAVNDADEVVGTVMDTFETAAHEVLILRKEKDERDLYIPFTLEHIPRVELETGQIVVRPPKS